MREGQPTSIKTIRQFGLILGGMVALLGGLFFPWIYGGDYLLWPWICGAVLWLTSLLAPSILKPVYIGWMFFGKIVGTINRNILLGIIFFIVITPIGIALRLISGDPLSRKYEPGLKSYRKISDGSSIDKLERPF